ncbi:MAG: hypothetical protein CL740_06450 [Chloroflexi bacterium]|nr:hypothetical protein [Chloroflexota bacterium]|tara:strand:- start:25916 stop:26617 length:702 start_codon:yes stop_codon:yes gene_type:complete
MYIVMVRLEVKKDKINEFINESISDARGSVEFEPGCRRFDIVQDNEKPNLFGFCEIYNDKESFEEHLTYPHFKQWDRAVKNLLLSEPEVSFCKPVFPLMDALWDSKRNGVIENDYFESGLHIIHAPKYIKSEKVDDFIAAVKLDGLGSTHEEQGCLRFDVYQNINDKSEIYLYEVYVNDKSFDYHKGTPHINLWIQTVKDWYDESRNADSARRVGKNIWPPDNWNWSSGKPLG